MTANKKGTPLQNGILHQIFFISISVLLLFISVTGIIHAYKYDMIPNEFMNIIVFIFSVTFSTCIALLTLYLSSKINIVKPITLKKVILFSEAMKNIPISDFNEKIKFISIRNINLYFTTTSLAHTTAENVTVKRQIMLNNTKTLKYYNGDNRLCIDFDDYEQILQEHNTLESSVYTAKIVSLEDEKNALKATITLLHDEATTLRSKIDISHNKYLECEKKCSELKTKLHTAHARDGKSGKREQNRIPFWRVAAPVINTLLSEATPETRYTRAQIQEAFIEELENFPDIKDTIKELLTTPTKVAESRPYDLEGWAMESIRNGLGTYVKK